MAALLRQRDVARAYERRKRRQCDDFRQSATGSTDFATPHAVISFCATAGLLSFYGELSAWAPRGAFSDDLGEVTEFARGLIRGILDPP
jgi:hypothetical protein